jgi:hypothetical protein
LPLFTKIIYCFKFTIFPAGPCFHVATICKMKIILINILWEAFYIGHAIYGWYQYGHFFLFILFKIVGALFWLFCLMWSIRCRTF